MTWWLWAIVLLGGLAVAGLGVWLVVRPDPPPVRHVAQHRRPRSTPQDPQFVETDDSPTPLSRSEGDT